MFDVGFWELAIVAMIALIILGPERLPRAARTAGLWVGRARRMLADVKADIDREIRSSELQELRSIGDEVKEAGADLKKTVNVLNENIDTDGDATVSTTQAADQSKAS